MKWTALSCCRVYSMLLPVLPSPKIIFWPVHEKSSAKKEILSKNFFSPFSAKFGQNSDTNSSSQLFISPALFELFGRNFGHLATLTPAQPPSPPLPLLTSLPCFLPLPPSSPPTDCSISQILKDDYRLPFYEIIILCPGSIPQLTLPLP